MSATILTQGGRDPGAANGGTVLALVGHCLDEVPTLVPMTLSRFTADIHRPVPIGRRLHVVSTVIREGKKVQIVQLQLVDGDVELVRVSALRIRDEAVAAIDPTSTSDARPADSMVPPEQSIDIRSMTPQMPGLLGAVDMRRAKAVDGRSTWTWVRLTAPADVWIDRERWPSRGPRNTASDVRQLVEFYEQVTKLSARWATDEFAELLTEPARLPSPASASMLRRSGDSMVDRADEIREGGRRLTTACHLARTFRCPSSIWRSSAKASPFGRRWTQRSPWRKVPSGADTAGSGTPSITTWRPSHRPRRAC